MIAPVGGAGATVCAEHWGLRDGPLSVLWPATLSVVKAFDGDAVTRRGLTTREVEVLDVVLEGLRNSEIADRLAVSERTVESHVSSLLHKLGVGSRNELGRVIGRRSSLGPGRLYGEGLPLVLQRLGSDGRCVGRERQLEQLWMEWDSAQAETRIVLVRGEAGIGKSRVVAEFATQVHASGGRVVLGACVNGPQRPLEPFVAAFGSVGGGGDALLGDVFEVSVDDRIGGDTVDRDRERIRVHGALYDRIAELAAPAGLLFVLEDLHWGSAGTREVLMGFAASPRRVPVLIVTTTRDDSRERPQEYATYLGRLSRSPMVMTLPLGGLDVAAASELLAGVGASLDPAVGVAQSGGNPLFLLQLAVHGAGSRSLSEAVAERFEAIDGDDLAILDAVTVCGEPIDATLIAAVLHRRPDEVLDALERVEAAGVIRPGPVVGTFAFTHDVFQSGRYVGLTASRRMRLHAAAARALDGTELVPQRLAVVARHACLAGARFNSKRAAELARAAGDMAAHATDYGDAAAHGVALPETSIRWARHASCSKTTGSRSARPADNGCSRRIG